jgi:hypothetical protein
MKKYTAKMSFEFAFKCPENKDPKEEAIQCIEYFGSAVGDEEDGWFKRETIKVEIFDLDKYQPSDYEKGEYELFCRYVEN